MKREFLQELQVNGQPLPKAVIDAIMAENGRDIEAAKASVDADGLRQEAENWKSKFAEAEKNHAQQLDRLAFEGELSKAVTDARGRNLKAITALLDLDALQAAQDRQSALLQAVNQLKQEAGYLFEDPVPPPYAGGTGSYNHLENQAPTSLAGALREKFERK